MAGKLDSKLNDNGGKEEKREEDLCSQFADFLPRPRTRVRFQEFAKRRMLGVTIRTQRESRLDFGSRMSAPPFLHACFLLISLTVVRGVVFSILLGS